MDKAQENLQKNRRIVVALALGGALQPTPIPLAGMHKFYLGQYGWGMFYLLLGFTQVPRLASAAEALWYIVAPQWRIFWASRVSCQSAQSMGPALGETVEAVAKSLREIEHLRQEGLLSELEFEQKRRSLLKQMPGG